MLLTVPSKQRSAALTQKPLPMLRISSECKNLMICRNSCKFPQELLARKIRLSRPLAAVDGRTGQFKSAHLLVSRSKDIPATLFVAISYSISSYFVYIINSFCISEDVEIRNISASLTESGSGKYSITFYFNFCTVDPNGRTQRRLIPGALWLCHWKVLAFE